MSKLGVILKNRLEMNSKCAIILMSSKANNNYKKLTSLGLQANFRQEPISLVAQDRSSLNYNAHNTFNEPTVLILIPST